MLYSSIPCIQTIRYFTGFLYSEKSRENCIRRLVIALRYVFIMTHTPRELLPTVGNFGILT